jgi:hypothetical protein
MLYIAYCLSGPDVDAATATGLARASARGGSLEALLRRARAWPSPKPRLVALAWGRSLYQWDDFVIETLFMLIGLLLRLLCLA